MELQVNSGIEKEPERLFHNFIAAKPVIVKTEAVNPVLSGKCSLPFQNLCMVEAVEPEIVRDIGLAVPPEQGRSPGNIPPLSETPAIILVIYGYCMKLRQVIGEYLRIVRMPFI